MGCVLRVLRALRVLRGALEPDSRNHMLHSIYQQDMPEGQYLSMGLEAGYCWDFIANIYP